MQNSTFLLTRQSSETELAFVQFECVTPVACTPLANPFYYQCVFLVAAPNTTLLICIHFPHAGRNTYCLFALIAISCASPSEPHERDANWSLMLWQMPWPLESCIKAHYASFRISQDMAHWIHGSFGSLHERQRLQFFRSPPLAWLWRAPCSNIWVWWSGMHTACTAVEPCLLRWQPRGPD